MFFQVQNNINFVRKGWYESTQSRTIIILRSLDRVTIVFNIDYGVFSRNRIGKSRMFYYWYSSFVKNNFVDVFQQ